MAKSTGDSLASPSPSDASVNAKPRSHSGWIPEWLIQGLHTRRTWKNWARSMICIFVCLVLMIVQPSLEAFGQAAFFGLIAAVMLPPMFPLSIYMFLLTTLGLGMLLGWAWGAAAMAAALRARSGSLLMQQQQEVQASMNPDMDPRIQSQRAVFDGRFLDPGSSAVYGVFLFFGAYAFAWLRALAPMLTLCAIYASIIMDMMVSIGPLLPAAQYTLAKQMLTPAAAFMAVGLACTVIFFPQSLNHLVLATLVDKNLRPILELVQIQDEVLKTSPSDEAAWTALSQRCQGARVRFIGAINGVMGMVKMLQLEVSRGRVDAGQLGELVNRSRELSGRAFGLGSFVTLVEEFQSQRRYFKEKPMPHAVGLVKRQEGAFMKGYHAPGRSLDDLLPQVADATADLRQAVEAALGGGIDWLNMVNHHRWKKTPAGFPDVAAREANLRRLEDALLEFRTTRHFSFIGPFESLFDPETGHVKEEEANGLAGSVRGLFRCYVFTSSLITFSKALIRWLQLLALIERQNPKNKFLFPSKFVEGIVDSATEKGPAVPGEYNQGIRDTLTDDLEDPSDGLDSDSDVSSSTVNEAKEQTKKQKKKRSWARDPDARPPRNGLQRFGRTMSVISRALSGPNGVFALKYALISIALWVPAVCPSSARFYYQNRGLWALIMGQTGLGIYAGEQVLNFITRMGGTIAGAVVGMVAWYIGAQKGSGNPYGVCAATMVAVAPFIFIRMACPPDDMGFWLMTGVTLVFVVGYSWVDEHVAQIANSGAGYTLAGRRALLVIIGFAGAIIISFIPKPVSAKRLVRYGLSKNINDLSELFSREITAFERSRVEDDFDIEERRDRYRAHMLMIFKIQQRMEFASFEPGIRGPWPKDLYEKLVKIQGSMLVSSAILASAYSELTPEWCRRLTDYNEMMNPAFITDCISLFALLRYSLRNGTPLPPTVPIFERLAYHRGTGRSRMAVASRRQSFVHLPPQPARGDARAGAPGSDAGTRVEGAAPDEEMTLNERALVRTVGRVLDARAAHDEQLSIFASALIAIVHVVGGLNALHSVVLELVGERELENFDLALERWGQLSGVV